MSYKLNEKNEKEYYQTKYIQKYYEELFTNMLNESYDEGLISHNERFVSYVNSRKDISSYYVMTLSIISDTIEDVYYDMNDVYLSSKILYALDTDLDDIGSIVGCSRPLESHSCAYVNFKLPSITNSTVTIPPNTIVSTNTGISYYTVESTNIEPGNDNVDVYCLSLLKGSQYRVGSNTLTNLETTFDSNTFQVNNEEPSKGGFNRYNDEEYRELILNWVKNHTRGSGEAYERYFANLDGVDGYKLVPNWDGISGTIKIIVDPGYPQQLREIYSDITTGVAQFSEDIYLSAPTKVPISISAKCNVDIDVINPYSSGEKEEIKKRIIEAIVLYVNGDIRFEDGSVYTGLGIGEDFIPYQLGVFLNDMIPELKNITFKSIITESNSTSTLVVKNGTYDIVVSEEEELVTSLSNVINEKISIDDKEDKILS